MVSKESSTSVVAGDRPQHFELAAVRLIDGVSPQFAEGYYAARKRLWLLPERFGSAAFVEMFCTAANVGDSGGGDCDLLTAPTPTVVVAATEVGQSLWGPNLESSVEHLDAWRSARDLSDGRSCFELRAYMGPGADILRFGWQQVNTVDDRLEFRVDGALMELKPAVAGWQRESLDFDSRGVRRLQWCYIAVGGHDLGGYAQLNALSFGGRQPEPPAVSDLADYCQVLDITADAQRCAVVLQSAQLQRLAADGTPLIQRDVLLREGDSTASLFIAAGVLDGGESQCLDLEFSTADTATIARLAFSWAVDAGSDGALMFYFGDSAEPAAVLGADDVQRSLVSFDYWVPSPENGPYRLRWCYQAGAGADGLGGWLDAVSVEQYRHGATISTPTADNRRVEETVHRVHDLEFRLVLQNVSLGGELLELPVSETTLTLRSDLQQLYIMRGSTLVPLELQLRVGMDGVTTTTIGAWLPQSRSIREQSLSLFLASGLRVAGATVQIPATTDLDGAAMALNRFCTSLLSTASIASCQLLILPAVGIGEWMFVDDTARGTLIDAPSPGPTACLRLLIDTAAGSAGTRLSFRWQGVNENGARLAFYVGESQPASGYAPTGLMPGQATALLPPAPDAQLLRWCPEGSEGTAGGGTVFRPLVLLPIADTAGSKQALTPDLLLRLRPFFAECAAAGEASPRCLVSGDRPAALAERPALADIPADRLDQTWLQFDRLRTSGELDIDRSGEYDQLDLRLMLRYLAGLRGAALSTGMADEAGLRTLLSP